MKIQAVFFDFDGVLIDSMPAHVRAWSQILAGVGIHLDDLYFRLHEGEKADDTIRALLKEHHVNLSDSEQLDLIERKRQLYRGMAPQGLIPAAKAVVHELIARQVECSIVTGSVRNNMDSVLLDGELELFKRVIAADDYERGKPFPDPYLMAIEQAGFDSDRCVVLENAPMGIESAKQAGLKTFAITSTLSADYLRQADVIISDYNELLMYL